jgi:hypothetical protein
VTPAPQLPAPVPAAASPVDIGALWKRISELAEASPRDQAMVDSFAPVSFADGVLVVRRARAGSGAAGTAIVDMMVSIATRAAGRPMRVRVDADPVPRKVEVVAAPAVAPQLPGRAPSLRDDPVVTHALVREVSALFDATIVRVEAAGTLPASAAAGAQAAEATREEGRDDVDPLESLLHGEHDV